MRRSFQDWPPLETNFEKVTQFALDCGFSHTDESNGFRYPRGRRYDDAMFLTMAAQLGYTWAGKTVCEIGARDSLFASYLVATENVAQCLIGDGLGDIEQWSQLWRRAAGSGGSAESTKLSISNENILDLSYPDRSVDVVICKAVLEHVPWQTLDCCGHHRAIHEIERILKPGGLVFISTQVIGWNSERSVRYSGTQYWSVTDLRSQLLSCPGLSLIERPEFQLDFNFSFSDADDIRFYTEIGTTIGPCSSMVFVLHKS
jgi:SAM-dependent methyltransferase